MTTRFFLGNIDPLGEDECEVIAITDTLARDGDIWDPAGIDLSKYRANPVVLRNHNSDQIVGAATAVGLVDGAIGARIRFAPPGVSAIADETRGLVKAGILGGVSAGIIPLDSEPLRGSRGARITSAELLELSLVPVPSDPAARVVNRSHRDRIRLRAAMRALPTVSHSAIERVAARFSTRLPRSAVDWAEQMARHTHAVSALQLASRDAEREREDEFSYAQRQADLRRLSGALTH